MQIEIDIDLLIENDISADDYLGLYALYRKGFKTVRKLNFKPNWKKLEQKGFIKLGAKLEDAVIRQEFIDLFSSDFDQMFAELLSTYPMKVRTKTGSYRILRGSDPSLKTNAKAKDRYSWANVWPSFYWDLLTGSDQRTNTKFFVTYSPGVLWRFMMS